MPPQTWAMDTCVLYDAAACGPTAADKSKAFRAFQVLAALCGGRHRLVEDTEGRVAREYNRAWKRMESRRDDFPSRHSVHEFWKNAFLGPSLKVQRPIPNTVKTILLANNMKPEGDIAFIEAANGSTDRLIVTEDSDYSPAVIQLLQNTPGMGISVHNYIDTCTKANA